MKTEIISITTAGSGIAEAISLSERVGTECGLDRKQLLRLRLISEEVFGMARGITGDISAEYWMVYERKSFSIHFKAEVELSQDMYNELIATSTSGTNSAVKGFMGRLKNMIAVKLLPQESPSLLMMGLMSMGGASFGNSLDYTWSMSQYRSELMSVDEGDDADEARDELEKSIIANIADEIKVSIEGNQVEITVYKSFDKEN